MLVERTSVWLDLHPRSVAAEASMASRNPWPPQRGETMTHRLDNRSNPVQRVALGVDILPKLRARSRSVPSLRRVVGLGSCVLVCLALSPAAAAVAAASHHPGLASQGRAKQLARPAPGGELHASVPPAARAWRQLQADRDRWARALVAGTSRRSAMTGRLDPDMCTPQDPCGGGSANAYLSQDQEAQVNSYYCGPATMQEALGHEGISKTQSTLGGLLKTDSSGTAWSGVYVNGSPSTGRPMQDILNQQLGSHGAVYNHVDLPTSPTSTQEATYETHLQADIISGWPVAGNAWEIAGYAHLVGHPEGMTIYHWVDVRGFSSYGDTTAYEDSVHGASSISWSAGVPAYSSMSSGTFVTILGGYGYIW